MNRRTFIGSAAAAALSARERTSRGVSIVVDGTDQVAQEGPAVWAAKELEQTLSSRGVTVFRCGSVASAKPGDFCIVAAARASVPEGLSIEPGSAGNRKVLSAYGHDSRGLTYALLELADRAKNADDPVAALMATKAMTERPANTVRGMMRMFTSDVEDKPWYNDREMWPAYLTTLATQRFNRFHLAFGIGYDFIRQVTDGYFLFTYPFLLSVPGYKVRVPQLSDAERDRNLAMLRFISDETAARGIHFQLGLWMHGYEWIDSPNANYTIEGLDKTHARPILSGRGAHAAKGVPGSQRSHLPHPWRERSRRGQFRFLEDAVRRRANVRAHSRDRYASEGHDAGDARYRGGDRTTISRVA